MSATKPQTSEILQSLPTEVILAEMQRRLDCLNKPEKRLILIGPPGSGKGTQVRILIPGEVILEGIRGTEHSPVVSRR